MIHGKFAQGTTPVLEFPLPERTGNILNARFSFSQKDKLVLSKELYECILDLEQKKISVALNQQETYLFSQERGVITVRVKFLFDNNEVIISKKKFYLVEDSADKAVIF